MSTQDQDFASAFGIFGQKPADVKVENEEVSNRTEMFNADPEQSTDKIWRGLVKLMPNIHDISSHLIIDKVQYWPKDPRNGRKTPFDSPVTVRDWNGCPVFQKYKEWRDSDDARLNALTGELGWSKRSYALVQIIADFQNPENNGKILPWGIPQHVKKMINAKVHPAAADIEMGTIPVNVFDPMMAPVLKLSIGWKKTSEGTFRDWESGCEWFPNSEMSMAVDGINYCDKPNPTKAEQKVLPAEGTPEYQALQNRMVEILSDEETPSLLKFKYVEPTADQLKYIKEVLAAIEGAPINEDATETAATETAATETAATETAATEKSAEGQTTEKLAETPADTQKESTVTDTTVGADDLVNEIMNEQQA